jgi:hypothetical protein
MSVTLIGDWSTIKKMTKSMNTLGKLAMNLSLERWALKAEGIAKMHISTQDMADGNGWPPLSPYTVERKTRLGFTDMTLIETGNYFQSITSKVNYPTLTAFAGVSGVIKGGENAGMPMSDLAIIHEYGFLEAGIPPRPLWEPTFEETMAWHLSVNTPRHIFMRLITAQILNR